MATAAYKPGRGHVYLLHFSAKIGHSSHYLGWALDVEERVQEHRAGCGANFTRVAVKRGISLLLAATWPGGRELERAYKLWHGPVKLCPICHAHQEQEPTGSAPRPATLWDM